jgi:hypothetical protein
MGIRALKIFLSFLHGSMQPSVITPFTILGCSISLQIHELFHSLGGVMQMDKFA